MTYGHSVRIPTNGHPVVPSGSAVHDGVMAAHRDLEPFWPSRRMHAFDELCR